MTKLLVLLALLTTTAVADMRNPPSSTERQYLYNKNNLSNGGFEGGKTGWSSAITLTTTSGQVSEGTQAGAWDPSASGTIQSPAWTTKAATAFNAMGSCKILTADADYDLQVYDGTNIVAEVDVPSGSVFSNVEVGFVAAPSTTYRLRLEAQGDESVAYVDDCFLGESNRAVAADQTSFYGGIRYAGVASCNWGLTNTGGFVDFATDDDCTGRVLSGNATGPADSAGNRKPAVTFSYLPPGNYQVVVTGNILMSNSSGGLAFQGVRLSDGTSVYSPPAAVNLPTGDTTRVTAQNIIWNITYSSAQTNKTFIVQANSSASGGVDIQTINANQDFEIKVYRYPLASEVAYRVDTIATSWSGYHDSTCAWSSSSGSFVTPSADASCGFTERTNTNFGTVTSTGSKTPGITFTPIRVGKYRVCASTQLLNDTTLSYSRLRLTDGTNVLGEATARAATGGVGQSVAICGILPITSLSAVSLNLQINASGNTTQLGAYDNGVAAIDWSLNAIDQQVPAPVLIGSLTTNSAGAERIERAKVVCSSSSSITSQSGSWISSIGNISSGACVLTLASGLFSSAPVCVMNLEAANGGATIGAQTTVSSSTSVTLTGAFNIGGTTTTSTTFTGYLICMGPR